LDCGDGNEIPAQLLSAHPCHAQRLTAVERGGEGVEWQEPWRCKVNKRIVFISVLAVLMAASAYAQKTNFFELARTGTPQDVQAAIDKGANLNAMSSYGMTPLGLAAWYNKNPEVTTTSDVYLLLDAAVRVYYGKGRRSAK
jgi:hypothetical protein